jgi:hypothetical protein
MPRINIYKLTCRTRTARAIEFVVYSPRGWDELFSRIEQTGAWDIFLERIR